MASSRSDKSASTQLNQICTFLELNILLFKSILKLAKIQIDQKIFYRPKSLKINQNFNLSKLKLT